MKLIFIAIGILLFLSCSHNSELNESENTTFEYDKTKVSSYFDLIDSLNQKGYVPYYRGVKNHALKYGPSISTDSTFEGKPMNESIFSKDSLFYEESRKSFFKQDIEFLNWLLSFENDTLFDRNNNRTISWEPYISSNASVLFQKNSISESTKALELINYYLDGDKNTSSKCGPFVRSCKMSDYASIKMFIEKNSKSNTRQLKKLWASKK